RDEVFSAAGILLQVRAIPAEPARLRRGQAVIGFADPLASPDAIRALAEAGTTAFSMELMPRITRAQSMDALSSMATIAGYKGVLMAADHLPRMFPMLMTAAGTLTAARVFIVGAGVAGLQAIATARRLGARGGAYAVRREGAAHGGQGGGLVRASRGEGAGAEPRGPVRRNAARDGGRRGQGGLREGAGRVVLPPAARDDAESRGRHRCGHHDGADPGQEGADAVDAGDGRGDGAGIRRRRSRGGARRQLRAHAPRRGR